MLQTYSVQMSTLTVLNTLNYYMYYYYVMHSIHAYYVVVQFYPWFNFYFPLFLCMVIYDNGYKTKENKNLTKNKIEPQHIHVQLELA